MNDNEREAIWSQAMTIAASQSSRRPEKGSVLLVDAAIAAYNAWLWEQAERPEFVKMVAKALEGMGDSDEWHDTPDERELGNAEVAISNTLYFLLGPRKEATDG